MKSKIAFLFAGGTIGMVPDKKNGGLKPVKNVSSILKLIPELKKHMKIDFYPIVNIDSSNMSPVHWDMIASKIYEIYDGYDGFVVAQGTDTMAYTASAVSFALQTLSKPVVFTGSIAPIGDLSSDARSNFINSCVIATMDLAEVCIVFGNKIIRGCKAKKNHESFVDVFRSPNFPYLGEIERPIKLNEWRIHRKKRTLKYLPGFYSNVAVVKLYPGFDPGILEALLNHGVHGIFIEGFGPGNIPTKDNSIIPALRQAFAKGVPVLIGTQMEKSQTNLNAYEPGIQAMQAGAVGAGSMTSEAAITKLMWALARKKSFTEVRRLIGTNVAGEM